MVSMNKMVYLQISDSDPDPGSVRIRYFFPDPLKRFQIRGVKKSCFKVFFYFLDDSKQLKKI